jgi:hypothetical protein
VPSLTKMETSDFMFRYWFMFTAEPLRWMSPIILTLWSYLLTFLAGTHAGCFVVYKGFLISPFTTLSLIIVGILLLTPCLIVVFLFMELDVEDDHS